MSHTVETAEKIRQRNNDLMDAFDDGADPRMTKKASASLDGFVRVKLREDCVMDEVIPPIDINDSQFTLEVHDDNPSVVCEIEPDSPAAVTVGFGTSPTNVIPYGKRYRLRFRRIMTKRFVTDIARLRTYRYDVREVITDNSVRDMYAEKDSKWFSTVETALGGSQGATVLMSGISQWRGISGGQSRQNLMDALAIIEETPGRWPAVKCICNHLFRYQVMKNNAFEAGNELAQDWLKNGWTDSELLGRQWRASIKRDIIPDNRVYFFTQDDAIGHHLTFEEVTMSVKREYFMLMWFAYGAWGSGIANVFGMSIADFT